MISHADPSIPALEKQVAQFFSERGALSRTENFEFRPQQQQMAVAVIRALEASGHLVVEAGTGVGKSFAYLLPAILFAKAHNKKALISTHTINLQEQLILKDIPFLKQHLAVPFDAVLLKGRHNYLCPRRLKRALENARSLFASSEEAELQRITAWAANTKDGSLSDFDVEPDPKVWEHVCSERGICTPAKCKGTDCFYQKARARVLRADVVVLNHTLFFVLLGATGENEEGHGLLFENDFVIFDEAHTIESVAAKHIGLGVSQYGVRYTLQRFWNPKSEKGILSKLRKGPLVSQVDDLLKRSDTFFRNVDEACERLTAQVKRTPTEIRVRRPDLVEDVLSLPLGNFSESIAGLIKETDDKELGDELRELNRRLGETRASLRTFLSQSHPDFVYWVERAGKSQRNLTLNAAPVDLAAYLRKMLFEAPTSVVMTSATLAVNRTLAYFKQRHGAEQAEEAVIGSPFDYARQMQLFIPKAMPDPHEENAYRDALVRWVHHFVEKTQGKALVLFTSYKTMQEVHAIVGPILETMGLTVFLQGEGMSRTKMLERFKADVNSVLFGTESFWQGVDVPGEALSNVIITRLPFAVPDHPLIEAKLELIEQRGGDPFKEYSLPEAVLKLRQGVGRLIRTKRDKGIAVILDSRILNKSYGRAFLDSLPECPVEIV
jgi:ATP-dependent DNA helicase DinG